MKSFQFKSLLLLAALIISLPSFGQGLKAFKLKNGLSVYIWEDESKSDVFGLVGVRAGSINDPEEYTGLAHYLEHVMFKGTDKIGALNWTEEEPIYKEIIAKYDQMAEEADPAKKEAISKEINELTVKAGKLGLPNEYSNLMESMGAKGVNAGTYYDWTFYQVGVFVLPCLSDKQMAGNLLTTFPASRIPFLPVGAGKRVRRI